MARIIVMVFPAVAFCLALAACGGGSLSTSDKVACNPPAVQTGIRALPWGYYPGYGCGPVPPPRTIYP